MKNILIISLNSGGTMGHGKIITSLANFLSKNKKNVTILSDMSFSRNFYVNKNVNVKNLHEAAHINYTIGGMCDYSQKNEIYNFAIENSIECVILSTFFDLDLVKKFKEKKIKTILLNYPLRDTYRFALKQNKAYEVFEKVITLYGPEFKDIKMQNETLVNPLKIAKKEDNNNLKYDILVTCGGGGRPSSKIFLKKVILALKKIAKENENLKIIIIKGNSKSNLSNNNFETIIWKKDFGNLLSSSRVIISEAGYFTMLDLINYRKKAILIPGERIIDNQEIRALKLEELGIGKIFFPFEKVSKLVNMIKESLNKENSGKENYQKIIEEYEQYEDIEEVLIEELK
jgi:UDP-N-acetylglucosamine:LPS N-acetylglucosamine transferase